MFPNIWHDAMLLLFGLTAFVINWNNDDGDDIVRWLNVNTSKFMTMMYCIGIYMQGL